MHDVEGPALVVIRLMCRVQPSEHAAHYRRYDFRSSGHAARSLHPLQPCK